MLIASLLKDVQLFTHFDFPTKTGESKRKRPGFDTGDCCAMYFHNFTGKKLVDCTYLTDYNWTLNDSEDEVSRDQYLRQGMIRRKHSRDPCYNKKKIL